MKILTFADTDESSRLLDALLKTAGGHTVVSNNSITSSNELEREDLAVLWLSGSLMEATSVLDRRQRLTSIQAPVLVIGAWQQTEEVAALLEAGADDYLAEPIDSASLALRLQVIEKKQQLGNPGAAQRCLEERLCPAQKVDTLTTLAGTLAHDFNNILAAIMGNAELALLDPTNNASTRYHLEQIDKASRRAADITRQMLTYSGRCSRESDAVNLSDLVEEMAQLLHTTISKRCTIHYHFTRPLPNIVGDAAQLRQVVMNLLINASESMGSKAGEIHVRTGLIQQDCEAWATLEIADTGAGMSEETLERIFDPFFTTKPSGRGLGLAAVQGIVHAHQGEITVESHPGEGSIFRLHFPVAREVASLLEDPSHELADWQGEGTILLIDDEEAVREAAHRLLRKAGYEVLEAGDGDQGAEVFCRHASNLTAVILDLNMPGLDGFEVYEVIREVRPEMRVIIWSGVAEASARERLRKMGDPVIVEKPTSAREIAAVLKRLLSDDPSSRTPVENGAHAGLNGSPAANRQPAAH